MCKKYVIDTNVPIIANSATQAETDITPQCILECVRHIKLVTKTGGLVLDADGEIFEEYIKQRHLSLSGQSGQGNIFLKWVSDNQWNPAKVTRIKIHKQRGGYKEFPKHPHLRKMDPSDRKFVAVSNAHPNKPAILQATDSKWWGWKDALQEEGIEVHFLCPEFIKTKFKKKNPK